MAITVKLIEFIRAYLEEQEKPEDMQMSVYQLAKKYDINTGTAYRMIKGEIHQAAFHLVEQGKTDKEILTLSARQQITIQEMWDAKLISGTVKMPTIRRNGTTSCNQMSAYLMHVPSIMLASTSTSVRDIIDPMVEIAGVGVLRGYLLPDEVLSAWVAYNTFIDITTNKKGKKVPILGSCEQMASDDIWDPVKLTTHGTALYTEYEIACIRQLYYEMGDMSSALYAAKVPTNMYAKMSFRINAALDAEITGSMDPVNRYVTTIEDGELPFDIDNLVDVCICAMRLNGLGAENNKSFYAGQGQEIMLRARKCFKALREFDVQTYRDAYMEDKLQKEKERKAQIAQEQKIIKDELQTRLDKLTLPKVEYTAAWAMETIQSHLDCQHEKSPIVLCYNLRHTHNIDIDSVSYAAVERFLKVTNIVIRTEVWKDQEAMIEGGTMVLKALLHLEAEERRAAQERPFDAQDYAEYLAETIMSGMSDRPFDQYKMRRYFAKRGSSLTEFETWMVTAEAIELKTEASTLAWTIIDSQAAQEGVNLNY